MDNLSIFVFGRSRRPLGLIVTMIYKLNHKLPNAADPAATMRGGANKVEIII